MFSIAMLPIVDTENARPNDILKKEEPISTVLYSGLMAQKNYDEGVKYASLIANRGYFDGYLWLLAMHEQRGNIEKFCSTMHEGYNKFGFEFWSSFIVNDREFAKIIFSNCVTQTPADLLAKAGKDGQLIQGYIYIEKGKYKEAYHLFEGLYKQGNASRISLNAGYCLGMMNYYGKGTSKNIDKGRQLLKESFNNGVFYLKTPEQQEFALPDKLEIISYYGGNCSNIQ